MITFRLPMAIHLFEFPIQIDRTINQITGMVTAIEQTVTAALSGKGTVGAIE